MIVLKTPETIVLARSRPSHTARGPPQLFVVLRHRHLSGWEPIRWGARHEIPLPSF